MCAIVALTHGTNATLHSHGDDGVVLMVMVVAMVVLVVEGVSTDLWSTEAKDRGQMGKL